MFLHPFEKAGLGKAPFTCTGMSENWYETAGGAHRQPGGSCNYCYTGILYEYHILSSDGKRFVVGSDCVAKTHMQGDTGSERLLKQVKKLKSRQVAKKRSESKAAKRRAALAAAKAERDAEIAARRPEFEAKFGDLIRRAKAYLRDRYTVYMEESDQFELVEGAMKADFVHDIVTKGEFWADLTPGQATAVEAMISRWYEEKRRKAAAKYLGEVGQRLRGVKATVVNTYFCEPSLYGVLGIFTLRTDEGDTLVVKSTSFRAEKLAKLTFDATVKDHSMFRDERQTVLTRVRVLDKVVPN